jgi:hypothetical protein
MTAPLLAQYRCKFRRIDWKSSPSVVRCVLAINSPVRGEWVTL